MSPASAVPSIETPRWYRHRWPWLLMAGPAIVALAGALTIWLAVASNDGLVSDDYYKRGLAINRQLERTARAEMLGIGAIVDVSANGVAQAELTNRTPARDAQPPALRLVLSHPTRAGADLRTTLRLVSPGRYAGSIAAPAPGRWSVIVETDDWRLSPATVDGRVESVALGAAARN